MHRGAVMPAGIVAARNAHPPALGRRPLRWRNFCATRSPDETSLASDGKICRTVSVLETGRNERVRRGASEREKESGREGVDSLFTLEQ